MLKRLAVLGFPVAHSLSPVMHTAALRELSLADEWSYDAITVRPEDFETVVRSLPEAGYVGVNVTIPHKEAALGIASVASERARAIGAANMLSFEAGSIEAENTDAPGLIAALNEPAAGRPALVLGAGGAARAAAWALADAGAAVRVWSRTPRRTEALAADLQVRPLESEASRGSLPVGHFEILVNATPVGLQAPDQEGDDLKALHLDADSLTGQHLVVDLAYGAEETELVRVARRAGATAVDGRDILVRQGAVSLQIWTGREPPLKTMREAIKVRQSEERSGGF